MSTEYRNSMMPMLTVVLLTIALFAAFAPGEARAGAPLKGVDVKLGKNPGGSPAARTTDERGTFDFGVVAKGSYYLTVAPRADGKSVPAAGPTKREAGASNSVPDTCLIEINGAVGGPIQVGWDLKTGKRLDSGTGSGAKGSAADHIIVNSDGSHPLKGAVVRTKSNISNN